MILLSSVLSSIKQSLVIYFDLFGVLLMAQVMLEFNHCNFPCCADLSSVVVENLTAAKMVYQKKLLHSNSNKTKEKMKRQQVDCLLGQNIKVAITEALMKTTYYVFYSQRSLYILKKLGRQQEVFKEYKSLTSNLEIIQQHRHKVYQPKKLMHNSFPENCFRLSSITSHYFKSVEWFSGAF